MVTEHKLNEYQRKRNFDRTLEPSGRLIPAGSKSRRFVIQKHDARRLHYDLRLEVDGVFKSWAVTRGPSLDPHDKRLAVEVEDHPLDYGDFEGTIPQDEYGGGTVQLWDRGYWAPVGDSTPEQALAKGDFKFVLAGDRLQGGWVLVRMKRDRNRSKRINWLLIKHQDEFARDGSATETVLEQDRSIASGRSMQEITAGKGKGPKNFMQSKSNAGKADASWSTAEKTATRESPRRKASPMPDFVAPQLCKSIDRPPADPGWAHEIKFDGYRMQLRIQGGCATLKTRSGFDWSSKFENLIEQAENLRDCIIDGEVVALNSHGIPDFAALQVALSEDDTKNLIFYAFDLLYEGKRDLRDEKLSTRKSRLQKILSKLKAPQIIYVEHFETGGDAILSSACKLSLEGIISKKLNGMYRSGRSEDWTKAKCRAGHEVVIGGWATTNNKFRSLLVGVYRDRQFVYVGRVGTGFSEKKVETLLPRLQTAESQTSHFFKVGAPAKISGIHWVRPTLVAEIEFAGWTSDGNVRQAAFKGLRDDKPATDVVAESPAPAKEASVPKADAKIENNSSARRKKKDKSENLVVMGVLLSHADKGFWPDADDDTPVTKLDLAQYFEMVGEWMLPHIQGRPCSIVRAPEGFAGQQFFQRHAMPGMSNLLELATVANDRKPYLEVNRKAGLAALAQIAALELHPWNCQRGQPDVPGRLIFDLDPGPDVNFPTVVAAANEMRSILQELDLTSFCKTTGGKGLHVVVPLAINGKHKHTWPEAKSFAHAVCNFMALNAPKRYVLNMAKKLRTGRIFLDYLRNDRMATAVAPLSPRARQGAPVSMPLTWKQVNPRLDPKLYTIRTVPALLEKTKAWGDYNESAGSLADAIKKLGKAGAAE